ncbi:MAG: hypothetical protein J1F38_01070 [Muribaculaceae bacterium]|nr:hypothetical protein [Muribaculaceae bacterium]
MKKFLLTLAAIAVTTCAWAESYEDLFPSASKVAPDPEYFTDMTQKNFRFWNTELTNENFKEALFPDLKASGAANLGANWIKDNVDYDAHPEYQDGIIVLGGAFAHNNATNQGILKEGMSIFDFGGEIGKALVINGNNSTFADYLYEEFKDDFELDEKPNIPKASDAAGDVTQFFWVLDKAIADQPLSWEGAAATVRVRVEMNIYNPGDANIFSGIYRMNGNNELKGSQQDSKINSSLFRQYQNDFVKDAKETGDVVPNSWNPFRWAVYEFDFTREEAEAAYGNLKMHLLGGALNKSAILIRNVEVYYCGHNVAVQHPGNEISDPYRITWNDYTPAEDPNDDDLDGDVEEPNEEALDKNEAAAGEIIKDEDFKGFTESEEVKNSWVGGTAKADTYFDGKKNVELPPNTVTVDDNSIVIEAPVDLGEELHHGVVRIQTDIEVEKGQKYNFSCNVSGGGVATKADTEAPIIVIRLTSDAEGATAAKANKNNAGDLHYISNAIIEEGNLVMEVYYGGNAGQTITVDNIKFMANADTSAVEGIETDVNAPVEYYNLQGMKIANPEKGIYIKVQGDKVSKVIM